MRDRGLGRLLMVAAVAGLACGAVPVAAGAETKPGKSPGASASQPADPNTDNFCQYEGSEGHPAFQCDVKGRYAIGTPCICPGKPQIGKITHR